VVRGERTHDRRMLLGDYGDWSDDPAQLETTIEYLLR
jgi:hypothetical protein